MDLPTALQQLISRGEYGAARDACSQALARSPRESAALAGMGIIAVSERKYEEAIPWLQKAVLVDRLNFSHHINLGIAYLLSGNARAALRRLNAARRMSEDPNALAGEIATVRKSLAREAYLQGRWTQAVRHLMHAVETSPQDAEAWNDLGTLHSGLGRAKKASDCFRRAVDLAPGTLKFRSNLAVSLNYLTGWSPARVYAAHAELFRHLQPAQREYTNVRDPNRIVRIGYFSADFCFRPPAFFLPSLLRNHDKSRFVILCYSNTHTEDEYTRMMKGYADHWRDTRGMSDSAVCELVQADEVDILIDRTGHFEGGRPGLFALKPAPLQVSLPGYPATTGIPGMDYRFTDAVVDPPGQTDSLHTERLARLPHTFACYTRARKAPAIGDLPADRNGYITLGSFQKREKITPAMLRNWADILAATPGSRLTLHHLFSGRENVPSEFRRLAEHTFALRGVDSSRISWIGALDHYRHLEAISAVDIALDTYPYNGMTTTCECLFMGVPVVTLAGTVHAGRVGASFLSRVGLEAWVASSPTEYVQIALENARNLSGLRDLRKTLRQRMLASPLTDARAYTSAFEALLASLWRNWCESIPNAAAS